jgi:hypothetical protein
MRNGSVDAYDRHSHVTLEIANPCCRVWNYIQACILWSWFTRRNVIVDSLFASQGEFAIWNMVAAFSESLVRVRRISANSTCMNSAARRDFFFRCLLCEIIVSRQERHGPVFPKTRKASSGLQLISFGCGTETEHRSWWGVQRRI